MLLLLPQFIASLALVVFLSSLYGVARAHLRTTRAQTLLGLSFGIVAMLQMSAPLELMEGVILDMRNVPIALAGAFLGWRGALLCLSMAVMTRISIGGAGMISGVAGMMVSCTAGYLWSRATLTVQKRSLRQFAVLGLAVSSHMLTAVLLPWEACIAFFSGAALPMMALNLASIPLAAAFLERERMHMISEAQRATDDPFDEVSGLARLGHFRREAMALARSDSNGRIAGLMAVEIHGARALKRELGAATYAQLLGAIRLRLAPFLLPDMPPAALAEDGRLILPLEFRQVAERDDVETQMRRILSDMAYQMENAAILRVGFTLRAFPAPTVQDLEQVLDDIALCRPITAEPEETGPKTPRTKRRGRGTSLPPARRNVRHDRLFAAANVLLATKDS